MVLATPDLFLGESREALCPHSCWEWWGNRLAGRQQWGWTTDYREITAVALPFTKLVSPCSGNSPTSQRFVDEGKNTWVFDISLSFNARTKWHLRSRRGRSWHWFLKSHPPSGGWIKIYLAYIFNHARVRRSYDKKKKCHNPPVQYSPKETDSQLQAVDGQTSLKLCCRYKRFCKEAREGLVFVGQLHILLFRNSFF